MTTGTVRAHLNHGRRAEALPVDGRQETRHGIRLAGCRQPLEGACPALQLGVVLARRRQRGRRVHCDLVGAGVGLLTVRVSPRRLGHVQRGGHDRLRHEHQGVKVRWPLDELFGERRVRDMVRLRLTHEASGGSGAHDAPDRRRRHARQVGQIGIGDSLRQRDVCHDLELAQPLQTSQQLSLRARSVSQSVSQSVDHVPAPEGRRGGAEVRTCFIRP